MGRDGREIDPDKFENPSEPLPESDHPKSVKASEIVWKQTDDKKDLVDYAPQGFIDKNTGKQIWYECSKDLTKQYYKSGQDDQRDKRMQNRLAAKKTSKKKKETRKQKRRKRMLAFQKQVRQDEANGHLNPDDGFFYHGPRCNVFMNAETSAHTAANAKIKLSKDERREEWGCDVK